jgi:hypothetical protein
MDTRPSDRRATVLVGATRAHPRRTVPLMVLDPGRARGGHGVCSRCYDRLTTTLSIEGACPFGFAMRIVCVPAVNEMLANTFC